MYIKSYEAERFAGLKDVKLEFNKGINVILGPNESGKSTVIHGIHSTLFKNIKLKMNNNKDKNFHSYFMPISGGDSIDGKVVLETKEGEYEISKEWGSNENIILKTPNNKILKDEKTINKELLDILSFGESTYSNIVFAKQKDLKAAINNIIEDKETTNEISDLLRKTLMELDGVSIDKIEENLMAEIEYLYKKWDIEKNYPENNKGVNNQYKVGLGEIIKKYYEKEELKVKMEEANISEKNFEEICQDIKTLKDDKDKVEKEKDELELIEEDVNKRSIIESELNSVKKDLYILSNVYLEWPKTSESLKFFNRDLERVNESLAKLNNEKSQIESINRKKYIEEKLDKINSIKSEIKNTEEELLNIKDITKEDLDLLEKLNSDILTKETEIKAGKIIALVKKSKSENIFISKDFLESEKIKVDETFEANGIININYNNEFEIEIKTGELDFEELSKNYKVLVEEFKEKLKSLDIDSISDARKDYESRKNKKLELKSLEENISILIGEEILEDLEKELFNLKDINTSLNIDEINKELENLNNEKIEILSNIKTSEQNIEKWTSEYKSEANLIDLLIEIKFTYKNKKDELENLKPLPERFSSTDEFRNRLYSLRSALSRGQGILENLNDNYYNAKNNLLDETYEELKKAYLDSEKSFIKLLNKGKKLLEIKDIFYEVKEDLDNNPMEPLVKEFKRLLQIITKDSFINSNIDDDFNIDLKKEDGSIPLELLSAGTYDAVTLALRFSILNYIFDEKYGYVVLDDCLVDLDPERKEESVNLIKDFAKSNQIIFTTCDPNTASMLGGNLIEL
ncbi:ATP-binding protein [Peptoniphilus stercorisuis]|uniref:Exonuclease SbcC n=1 Tax=Peptoniphilus stercorisuis TaxID=1436965 RepID=A0ABS4KBB9_9FIRM|nr:AAA family ATPase [Peptoniphilus stercorisuis]MBP2025064.1 exonuclease SbcC [Peptoniphilus stercorisuis]